MSVRGWLRSDRITTQIMMLVFASGVLALSLTTIVIIGLPPEQIAPANPERSATRVGTLLRALDSLPPAAREDLVAAYRTGDLTIELASRGAAPSIPAQADRHPLMPLIARELPSGSRIDAVIEQPGHRLTLVTRLADGTPVVFHLQLDPPPPAPMPLLPPLLFLGATSIALFIWAALRIVAPLSRFSAAVEKFDLAGHAQPLVEEGPAEIRLATGAFNRMSERILRLMADRTRMMMAISHDLRTPLTRLRLRSEDVPDRELQSGMLRDIEAMEVSIADAVSNLRHVSGQEERSQADLPSLLETICSDFSDAGFSVAYSGPRTLAVCLRPQAVSRAVTNLVQNATTYGSLVTVTLTVLDSQAVAIDVEDDGPGIPDSEKEAVLRPFYRSDPSRQKAGGFGLGLAIALEVVRDHAGALTLHDRRPHGLRARLRLPLQDDASG